MRSDGAKSVGINGAVEILEVRVLARLNEGLDGVSDEAFKNLS